MFSWDDEKGEESKRWSKTEMKASFSLTPQGAPEGGQAEQP